MTDLHPWVTTKLQPPIETSILFRLPPHPNEVIRLDKEGFHYRGQFIEDAGEAHRLMVEFLRQNTAHAQAKQPVAPMDKLDRLIALDRDDSANADELEGQP
jgi:hypothetical protein